MSKSRTIKKLLIYAAILVIFIYFVFPLFWMFWTSIKPSRYAYSPGILRFSPTFEGYIGALTDFRIPEMALNSVIVALSSTFVALFLGTIAAYSLSRFRFKLKNSALMFFLSARFLPPLALVLPLFLIGNIFGLLDTRFILVLVYQILCTTFAVLMMRGFLANVPVDYEEAAMLEGCSRIKAFFLVVIPNIKNGLFATGVFLFLYSWNEFPYALFLTSYEARTLPTAVEFFLGARGVYWNSAMAYGVMTVMPVFILAIIFRKYMVQGLTFGMEDK